MSIPVPIVECEGCQRRFGLTPQAFVEDEALGDVHLLCRRCREDDHESSHESWRPDDPAAA